MKIRSVTNRPRGRALSTVRPGQAVSFRKQLHQDHCVGDTFLVVNDNGYLDRHYPGDKKVVIANVETGKMSIVSNYRECYKVDAEVVVS